MRRIPLVRWVALFWGFAAFFPVGLNYTAFVLLAAAMAWEGPWRARLDRVRHEPNWWPAWLFLGWGALVLVFGPHYPETGSNAFHGLRVVVTLWLALALTRDEAVWALRGFVLGVAVALVLTALDLLVGLPPGVLWDSIVRYGGNKSLSNAVLLALSTSCGLLLLPVLGTRQRVWVLVAAAGSVFVLMFVLYSRTAWLVVVAGLVGGLLHQMRQQRQRQVMFLGAVAVLTLSVVLLVPSIHDRLTLGAQEVASAYSGQRVDQSSSWGVRFRMYTETAAMIRDRPLTGWGIGGWSSQWKERVEPALVSSNMPHNDFLWMGAQAGVPGALLLLALIAAGLPRAWRRQDLSGRLGVVALVSMLVAVTTNSAVRDASIGLSVWFVVLVIQRLSTEPPSVWREVVPGRPRPEATS